MEGIEEAFSCFLVHRPEQETEKVQNFQQELQSVLSGLNAEQQETGVRAYLLKAAEMTNHSRLQLLLSLLENLVASNILPLVIYESSFCWKDDEFFVSDLVDWHTAKLNFSFVFSNFEPQNTIILPLFQDIWQVQW